VNDLNTKASQRIGQQIENLDFAYQRAQKAWQGYLATSDDLYLDGVALNIHGFYEGIEQLFLWIATYIDDGAPQGGNSHKLLLLQMTMKVPSQRPAVISEECRGILDELREFRHVVRHIYPFQLDPNQMQRLVAKVGQALPLLREELSLFSRFLAESQ